MAWSHRQRFAMALRLARPHAGGLLLDYGCGDGMLLTQLAADFPQRLGAEIDPRLVAACSARFSDMPGIAFAESSTLPLVPDHSFAVILCTEVLEHCVEENLEAVIATLSRLLAENGTLIVSVPVETGPVLLVKHAARALKSARGRDVTYRERERFALRELATMVFARANSAIPRPAYRQDFADGQPNEFHGHKGFNWRALRARLDRTFIIERTTFSPIAAFGSLAASQAWFICRPR